MPSVYVPGDFSPSRPEMSAKSARYVKKNWVFDGSDKASLKLPGDPTVIKGAESTFPVLSGHQLLYWKSRRALGTLTAMPAKSTSSSSQTNATHLSPPPQRLYEESLQRGKFRALLVPHWDWRLKSILLLRVPPGFACTDSDATPAQSCTQLTVTAGTSAAHRHPREPILLLGRPVRPLRAPLPTRASRPSNALRKKRSSWVPTRDISKIQITLRRATEHSETSIPPILHKLRMSKTPPTYNRTNKFTLGFQTIMDSYSTASYQEVDPGLFAVITFLFLFAVMFGDIGHGFILFCAALYMITVERQWAKADLDEIVGQFFLSYKMKMSVILGVLHMTFALCLQIPNPLRFKRPIDIYLNFIPQMIFLQSIFGHLVVCILYKWSIDWSTSATAPPSLLNTLISMFLTLGTVDPATQLHPGQGAVQTVLLLPYFIWREMKQREGAGYVGIGHGEGRASHEDDALLGEEEANGNGGAVVEDADDVEHEQHYFCEVVIRQVIHTIEFCLGCISHTASYLRLWVPSLAHAQLSEVLWSMTIEGSLGPASILGWIKLALMGSLWFGCTVGILYLMEGSCMRSVEANSKHHEGGRCISAIDFCGGFMRFWVSNYVL
ncbi:V-type ATPase 116kDa subunit family-domain-containing protein [Mycena rebaudengoi]|nr:V-type ATPase 116kDa subunit family-domain-containing protein [Mycena rebaudengoi]